MSAWTPYIPNPDGTENSHGYYYPWPSGWPSLPPILRGLEGTYAFEDPESETGQKWYIIKGSPAFRRWANQFRPSSPAIVRGQPIRITPGILNVTPTTSVQPADEAPTGEGDPVSDIQYANDPDLGVVPIGVPTDQTLLRRVWNAPARAAAKLLPPGSVSESVALGMTVMPWLIWGALAWWIWRKVRR